MYEQWFTYVKKMEYKETSKGDISLKDVDLIKRENETYDEVSISIKYSELFKDFQENFKELSPELLDAIIGLFEICVPNKALVEETSIIISVCNAIQENGNETIIVKLYQLLTFFSCIEYSTIYDDEFYNFIAAKIEESDEYVSYVLICFLNLYSSKKKDYINENYDFALLEKFFSDESDIDTVQTCIQIYTIYTSTSVAPEIAEEICGLAIHSLESSHHELVSPSLFLLLNLLRNTEEAISFIYNEDFIKSLNTTLFDLEPNVLCPTIDIFLFLINKDHDVTSINIKNLVSLLQHNNCYVCNKAFEIITIMVKKYSDIPGVLYKEGLIDTLKNCLENSDSNGKFNAANLIFQLFLNTEGKYRRRLIRERLFDLIFSWIDFDEESIRDMILPIIDIVFSEATNSNRLAEVLDIFNEHDGSDTIDAIIEASTHKEEVEALADKIKEKFEIVNE